MEKLQFKIKISAPADKVYDAMLGLTQKSTYERWTSKFNPTSTYSGSWEMGSKIKFLGTDDKGQTGGMLSEIADNIPNRFVSIKHYGLVSGDQEITRGPEVEKWAGGFENYTFTQEEGQTIVQVDLDTNEEFSDYMGDAFPKALEELKNLCEV